MKTLAFGILNGRNPRHASDMQIANVTKDACDSKWDA
jgi:hypothetical protein